MIIRVDNNLFLILLKDSKISMRIIEEIFSLKTNQKLK